ncbi:MAG: alkylation repair protein [Actinomycetota bacterium]|nr:alkylation repair protein [Actinomycetota bacterium]
MATPLKDSFDAGVVAQIADGLPVAKDAFVAECLDGFDRLELKARGVRVAQVMHTHLHRDPATAIGQVASAIGPPLGFGYFAHSEFIGTYGLSAFEESMVAQHALTQVFTAEFCIRPFIAHDPRTMDRLYQWARDDSEHVRRLVSEGTRPRLPWAARLPQFQADPGPVLDLLDLLKDDPSEYVLRSVGNNLNDISRDNPQAALAVAADWLPQRGRLVRRGLRTLLKAGHPQALALLGYQDTDVVASAQLPARLQVGERLPIVVTLQGDGAVLLDLRVHYVKANGATSAKVFRGGEVTVQGKAHVRRTVSFAHHSTRRQYPGPHLIEALVNGVPHELAVVEVVP